MAMTKTAAEASLRTAAGKRDRAIIDQERVISAAREQQVDAWKQYAADLEQLLAKATEEVVIVAEGTGTGSVAGVGGMTP